MKLSIVISVLRLKETIIFCVFYFFGGHVLLVLSEIIIFILYFIIMFKMGFGVRQS